ncbi:hypothetical protein DM01DRAFT_1410186 [Hesseltinella vesiculosa]|uniref:BHLH domain-containing protein n=1 Tax=Hesseltinella vesiculosa TaxID=101127 RepID=A0A1X2G815_9FUNG|nr:hypothetical protein DM01DRAFT_1410186 [Hesseltinella vesiculosa]
MEPLIEYDETYDPTHKSSSITSIDSIPSLCSTSTIADQDEELEEPSLIDEWVNMVPLDPKLSGPLKIAFNQTSSEPAKSTPHDPLQESAPTLDKTSCLSKDERRANHIASEQKRRQNIKNGFQQLTELIPSLKSMPHSKSTILFKASEYIRHNEKRNKALRERLRQLQHRLALTSMAYDRVSPSTYASTQKRIRILQQQLAEQQRLLLMHNILPPAMQAPPNPSGSFMPSNTYMSSPMPQPQPHHPGITMPSSPTFQSTPCLHIPADVDDEPYVANPTFLHFHA